MPEREDLADWQRRFFSERVQKPASGAEGVYFREQVYGALDVLSEALPDLLNALGERNFRFFVREFLSHCQPRDALGTTLVEPFLWFVSDRPELSADPGLADLVGVAIEALRQAKEQEPPEKPKL